MAFNGRAIARKPSPDVVVGLEHRNRGPYEARRNYQRVVMAARVVGVSSLCMSQLFAEDEHKMSLVFLYRARMSLFASL